MRNRRYCALTNLVLEQVCHIFRFKFCSKEHENAVAVYERMQKVRRDSDAATFLESVKKAHAEDFNKKMNEWEKKLQEEKRKRLEERHELRKKERRAEWLQVCFAVLFIHYV